MLSINTGILSVLYYFIGPPLLIVILPLLMKYITRCLSVKNKLNGKVVLITGASSGLGEALSHEFYKEGCKLILAARRLDQLERVKSDLLSLTCRNESFTPEIVVMDVSELETLPDLANKALKIYGKIDILVNNAGVSFRGKIAETSLDVHQKIMLVNYFGQICLTKALLSSMISRNSGHIVMINSIQGKIGIPFRSAYAASKHALQAYSDTLRAELCQTDMNVTVINAGYINTSMSLNALTSSGAQYAKMDSATAEGYSAVDAAKQIISAIKYEEKEVILSPLSPRLAIFIRTLFPNLFFFLMKRRAEKNI